MEHLPRPGSDEAIHLGCECPVLDNNYGKGIPMPDGKGGHAAAYWIAADCPLHGTKQYPEVEIEQQGN